jgi:SAM-dependent methyltransferase
MSPISKLGDASMTDIVIDTVRSGEIDAANISFDKLRAIAGRQLGIHGQLGYGRSILSTHEQPDQYLHSYGPMIRSQWHQLLQKTTIPKGKVQILDYGCGQGLATALLIDNLGREFLKRVESVVLIEPSAVAIARAGAVLGCYCGKRPVISLQKLLDDLSPKDLKPLEGANNIHLLSNVLDIESFQHFDLFTKMFQAKGQHSVLAVSHNRNFHGGSGRFRELEKNLGDRKHSAWFSIGASRIDEFSCDNGMPAISWELHVGVAWICSKPMKLIFRSSCPIEATAPLSGSRSYADTESSSHTGK